MKSINDMNFSELEAYCNSKEVKAFTGEVAKAVEAVEVAKNQLEALKADSRFLAVDKYNRNVKSRAWHESNAKKTALFKKLTTLDVTKDTVQVQEIVKQLQALQ